MAESSIPSTDGISRSRITSSQEELTTTTNPIPKEKQESQDSDAETEAILAELESSLEDPIPQPSQPSSRTTHPIQTFSHTGLVTPSSEASLIKSTADAPSSIVLFYSKDFPTSLRMKDILSDLARQYSQQAGRRDGEGDRTVFMAAEAEKCEWLCRRLSIQVLPVIVGYVEGKEIGRVVGFEGVAGGVEGSDWRGLAWVLGRWGGAWHGTFSSGKAGGVLGMDWESWVGADGQRRNGIPGDDSDDEGEREERRRRGYVGGGGGSSRIKGGKMARRGVADNEDDDWD